MKALLFSDVHLDVEHRGDAETTDFIAFLRSIDPQRFGRVFILGDVFDFWFEYKHAVFSGYFDVLRAFADLRDGGVELHLVCGNHDLWAGRFLKHHLGFELHWGPVTMTFGGKRVLMTHGDGLNPRDGHYRMYKRVASAGPVVWLFRLIHPDWAMALARRVSRLSRKRFESLDLSQGPEVKPLQDFAKAALARGEADVVVCGHSHYPVRETYPTPAGEGLYINTGDWRYHRSYVEWDGDSFRLRAFRQKAVDEVAGGETHGAEQQDGDEAESAGALGPKEGPGAHGE